MFGAMMAMTGAASGSNTILALLSILSIVFYLYLIYVMFYDMGQKDGIKINSQRLAYYPYKALWISLFANTLNFLLGILTVLFKAIINGVQMTQNLASLTAEQVSALNPSWAVQAYQICDTLSKAIQFMYVGVLKVFFSGNVFILLVIPLPSVIIATLAYKLGVKYCNGFKKKSKKPEERYKV